MELHEKWILGIIITSMVFCLIELGVSFADGSMGGYSLWMAPVAAILTEILHIVTLPVWKSTAKKRKGTPKPSFIYSVTLCTLSCILAVFWFAVSIFTFVLAGSVSDYYYGESAGGAFAEATFALLLSGLTWAEFGIIVHYRKRFLKTAKRAKQASQNQGQNQGQQNYGHPHPVDQQYGAYGAQYGHGHGQHPAPPYPSPQPQPPVNVVNPMINPVVNPPYPVYNPNPMNQQQPYTVVNYQPPMAQVNPMQKDAGK